MGAAARYVGAVARQRLDRPEGLGEWAATPASRGEPAASAAGLRPAPAGWEAWKRHAGV